MKQLLKSTPKNVKVERPRKVRARHCGQPPQRALRHCGQPPTVA